MREGRMREGRIGKLIGGWRVMGKWCERLMGMSNGRMVSDESDQGTE